MYPITKDFIPKNPFTRPGTPLKAVRGVVVHWTANENAGADDVAHMRYLEGTAIKTERYASAAYFVDHDSILNVVPEKEMTYHVGAKRYTTQRLGSYPNNCTIGIEVCVNRKGEDFKKAIDRSAYLAATLLVRYNLSIIDLYRHYDVTGKDCPRYFVYDDSARAYGYESAALAWKDFKMSVVAYMDAIRKGPVKSVTVQKKPVSGATAKRPTSLVDYMKSKKLDSSFSGRSKLAVSHGIKSYKGTAEQNLQLLGKLYAKYK